MLKVALIFSTLLLTSTISIAEVKTINGEECYAIPQAPAPAQSPNPEIVKGASIIEYRDSKEDIVKLIRDLETKNQVETYYGKVVKQPFFVSNVSIIERTSEEMSKKYPNLLFTNHNGSRKIKMCGLYTVIISVESAAL